VKRRLNRNIKNYRKGIKGIPICNLQQVSGGITSVYLCNRLYGENGFTAVEVFTHSCIVWTSLQLSII
jgi:hypothetical protein